MKKNRFKNKQGWLKNGIRQMHHEQILSDKQCLDYKYISREEKKTCVKK